MLEKYKIEGYKTHYSESTINRADGVLMYIKNSIDPVITIENLGKLKIIQAKINYDQDKSLVIAGIYRLHQNKIEDFLQDLEQYLSKHKTTNIHYIFGDININTLSVDETSENYKLIYSAFGYLPFINTITRPNADRGSCLDHFFGKEKSSTSHSQAFILKNNISDH